MGLRETGASAFTRGASCKPGAHCIRRLLCVETNTRVDCTMDTAAYRWPWRASVPAGRTPLDLAMPDDNQIAIPRSFVELFIPPGAIKPRETRSTIAVRYELCEDMAQMLVDAARATLFDLGVAESDVLERFSRGLLVDGSVIAPDEAGWVIRRLAELLDWPALPVDEAG